MAMREADGKTGAARAGHGHTFQVHLVPVEVQADEALAVRHGPGDGHSPCVVGEYGNCPASLCDSLPILWTGICHPFL
jgi:hypothetical protein